MAPAAIGTSAHPCPAPWRDGGAPLLAGFVADAVLGDPARLHPVAGFGTAAAALERRMWRPSRAAGAAYAGALVGLAGVAGYAVARLPGRRLRTALGAALAWAALGGRSLAAEARKLERLVRAGDLPAARRQVRALVGRDTAGLDEAQLCRAAIESLADNTADAVIGPCVWGSIAGPAGVSAYRAANTLDAMVGHRSTRYERFGWAAARLDDVLTWPASWLGALLATALGPLVGGSPARAWRVLRRDGRSQPSPNAGRLQAAFAGALGIRLGGVNVYGGRKDVRPAVGDGRPPGPDDVARAVRLSTAVGAASVAVCAGTAAALGRATA